MRDTHYQACLHRKKKQESKKRRKKTERKQEREKQFEIKQVTDECSVSCIEKKKTRLNTWHKSFAVFVSARQKRKLPTDGPTDRRTNGRTFLI